MLAIKRPTPAVLQTFLSTQRERPFSYSEVGATSGKPPSGYFVDHRRTLLGTGRETFDRACAALRNWEQFQLGWVQLQAYDTPLAAGETVAIVAGRMRLWAMNACRIVYTFDETCDEALPVRRYGFAYGTLADHMERGEERFSVEWRRDDDSVWYDLLAFSWPNHFVAQCCLPYMRRLQKRFAVESARAMQRAVDASTEARKKCA